MKAVAPNYCILERLDGFRQTSPTDQSAIGSVFYVEVQMPVAVSAGATAVLTGPNGLSVTLSKSTDYVFDGTLNAPNPAALSSTVADGAYSLTITTNGVAATTTFTAIFGPSMAPVLIANYSAVQSWAGPLVQVIWQPVPGASFSGDFASFEIQDVTGKDLDYNANLSAIETSQTMGLPGLALNQTAYGTYTYSKVIQSISDNGLTAIGLGKGFSVEFTVHRSPSIPTLSLQPSASTTVSLGQSIFLNFSANNPPVGESASIQWYKDGVALPGQVYSSLTISAAKDVDAGTYSATFTTDDGSVTTSPAVVQIRPGLVLTPFATGFNQPTGMAFNAQGEIYVADSGNHAIRKISPGGVVTIFAGSLGQSGFADGTGTNARFNNPTGVAVDSAGNVYVTDSGNYRIRHITPAGAVTSYSPYLKSSRPFASYGPTGIAVAKNGTIYFSETDEQQLDEILPDGTWQTVAGTYYGVVAIVRDGLGAAAGFVSPQGLAFDPSGNLVVGDRDCLRSVSPGGYATTPRPSTFLSNNLSFLGYFPGVAVDGLGNAFGASNSGDILENTAKGTQLLLAQGLKSPAGIVVDRAGILYVAETGNNRILRGTLDPGSMAIALSSSATQNTVAPGSTAVFSASATGPGLNYQWSRNGTLIPGANGPVYVLHNAQAANAGTYAATVSNDNFVNQGPDNVLAVSDTDNPGRLVNLSVLSTVKSSLSMGWVIGGVGTYGTENCLVRAVGPTLALAPFNVPGTMNDPTLTISPQGGSILATDAGWGAAANNPGLITTTALRVGAFSLPNPASLDSAVVLTLPPVGGGYTATVTSKSGGTGYALTEVYDATPAGTYTPTTPRLINLSCLSQISPGGTLTVGFVLGGSVSKTLLIRVAGPTLAQAPFAIPGTMSDPRLAVQPLIDSSQTLAANAGWKGDVQLSAAATSVGAFAFYGPSTKDSAVLVTLPSGIPYTVQANSASGGGGWALVEIYEIP